MPLCHAPRSATIRGRSGGVYNAIVLGEESGVDAERLDKDSRRGTDKEVMLQTDLRTLY